MIGADVDRETRIFIRGVTMPKGLVVEGRQQFFEDVVDHMAMLCRAPIAIVMLVQGRRQWVSGAINGKGGEVDPEATYDALSLMGEGPAIVTDTESLTGFDHQSIDATRSGVRAFIAQPMKFEGEIVGYIYLADQRPREWGEPEIGYMERAARLMAAHVEARSVIEEKDRRLELETELARVGERYRIIFENLSEGVSVMNADGEIIKANPAAPRLLGLTMDQMLGRTPMHDQWRFIDDGGSPIPNDQNIALVALRTGRPQLGIVQGVNLPSGEMRWMHVSSVPMEFDENGRPQQVVSTFTDVTDERARDAYLMEALTAAERAAVSKQKFLADMSHEIRTPLNGVVGIAQALKMTNLDEEQADLVETILQSSATLTTLLNDVLDLSKIEAGKFEILRSEQDIAEFARRQLQLWKPRAQEKGLGLDLVIDVDVPPRLAFDGVRVQQCLNNLISNAVKFTTSGSVSLKIECAERTGGERMVTMSVSDTGPGMDEETLGRLFQPFTQADGSVATEHGGTGLGLSIARRLAKLMGGDASATSTPGKGSVFRFSFSAGSTSMSRPVETSSETVEKPAPPPPPTDDGRLRVLVVDDNPVNRQVAVLFLKPLNAIVVQASNGQEALDAMETHRFDIVLLDMHMPVLDGPGAIAKIRASKEDWSSTPVLAVTADAMTGDKERYLSLGLDGYLPKPLDAKDLKAEIARLTKKGGEPRLRAVG